MAFLTADVIDPSAVSLNAVGGIPDFADLTNFVNRVSFW